MVRSLAPWGVFSSFWNVKDYHWEEKDKTEWAKARLQELMGGVSASVGKKGTVRVSDVGVDGFLAVNSEARSAYRASN